MKVRVAGKLWMTAASLIMVACHSPSTIYPQATPEELREEEAIQHRMIEDYASRGGAPRPWQRRKGATKMVGQVAERLEPAAAEICQQMGLPQLKRRCYFYFRMSRSKGINAYADGDEVYVTSGMMSFIKDDDELAIVLAHEIAHNLMGHVKAGNENAVTGQLLGRVMDELHSSYIGYRTRDWERLGAEAGSLSYSQSFEKEADYIGMYIAARAGYNIRKAPGFWRRLSIEAPEMVYNSSTHPTNPERFVALKKTIQEIDYKAKQRLPLLPNMVKQPIEGDYEARKEIYLPLE